MTQRTLTNEEFEQLARRRPPAEALAWVANAIGRGTKIVSTRRLRGGSSSAVHAIDVDDRHGRRQRFVLRRFIRPNWQEPELAEREARILDLLKDTPLPVPKVLAVDAQAQHCDVPALLMERLPGRIDLQPRDESSWLCRLAEPLPVIHAVDALAAVVPPYAPYEPLGFDAPAWSAHPEAWQTLDALVRGPQPSSKSVFIHRDYHPANILWSRGRVRGILDWINASTGPREIDVAHARCDIVCLIGLEAADEFLRAYCEIAGVQPSEWDPYWDAHALSDVGAATSSGLFEGWEGIGLTLEATHARNDEYALSIAARV